MVFGMVGGMKTIWTPLLIVATTKEHPMDIPKELRHLLLQRGGMERITKELEARKRIREKPNVVYSTELEQREVVARDRNKGCCPSSCDLKADNVFDRATSGRTKF